MMRFRYAVTYEFPTRAPVTHRGTVLGSEAPQIAARAIRTAKKSLRPKAWSSVVCVLLERLPDEEATPGAKVEAKRLQGQRLQEWKARR